MQLLSDCVGIVENSQTCFAAERSLSFDVIPDGKFHIYTLDLAAIPTYNGTITGLRFDPADGGEKGAYVDIASLSWHPAP